MTQTQTAAPTQPAASRRASLRDWIRGAGPRNLWLAAGWLAISLTITLIGTLYVKSEVDAAAQREFDFICNEIQINIANRLAASAQLLYSSAGLFDASISVTREEWRTFNEHLQLERQLPGIQGVGFALLIAPGQLAQHLQALRAEGFPDYTVWPAGEREIYSSIIYLEPFAGRNLRAFGYDMFSEPVRRAAMEQARDGNIATLSGKIILVQETEQDVQAGALMYVPVYRHGAPIETVEQRRAALIGWVYSPYRMTDLMRGTLGNWEERQHGRRISLQVYDGDDLSDDHRLYDSQPAADPAPAGRARVTRIIPVDFAGRRWTLRFTEFGGTTARADYNSVWLVSFSGLSISLLLFGLALSLLSTRVNARRMAEHLTRELRESEGHFRILANAAPVLIWQSGPDGLCNYFNQPWLQFTGRSLEQELGNGWAEGVHPADYQHCLETYRGAFNAQREFSLEYRLRRADGEHRALIDNGLPRFALDGSFLGYIGTCIDITERKQAEDALRAALAEKEALIKEVHHRVKNNLQVMVSLLDLQAARINDPLTLAVFQDSRERVRSMALVHEKLYQSADLAHIQFGDYLRDLTQNLQNIYNLPAGVRVRVEAQEVWWGVDTAIPCGMLANELISNACKYAFKDSRTGTLRVTLAQLPEPAANGTRQFRLTVSDDGAGLPPGLNPAASQSLGLHLVQILTKQLNGVLTVSGPPGASFEIVLQERRERRV